MSVSLKTLIRSVERDLILNIRVEKSYSHQDAICDLAFLVFHKEIYLVVLNKHIRMRFILYSVIGCHILMLLSLLRPMHYSDSTEYNHVIHSFTVQDCLTGETVKNITRPFVVTKNLENRKLDYVEHILTQMKSFFTERKCLKTKTNSVITISELKMDQIVPYVFEMISKNIRKPVLNIFLLMCQHSIGVIGSSYGKRMKIVTLKSFSKLIYSQMCLRKNTIGIASKFNESRKSKGFPPIDILIIGPVSNVLTVDELFQILNFFTAAGTKFVLMIDSPQSTTNPKNDTNCHGINYTPNLSLRPYLFNPPKCITAVDSNNWLNLYKLPMLQVEHCYISRTLYKSHSFLSCP